MRDKENAKCKHEREMTKALPSWLHRQKTKAFPDETPRDNLVHLHQGGAGDQQKQQSSKITTTH